MLVKPKDMNDFQNAQEKDYAFFQADQETYDKLMKEREELGDKLFAKFTKGKCATRPKKSREELENEIKQSSEALVKIKEMNLPEEASQFHQQVVDKNKKCLDDGDFAITEEEINYKKLYDAQKQVFFKQVFTMKEWNEFQKKVDKIINKTMKNK